MKLEIWQQHISQWYQQRETASLDQLEALLRSAPSEVWGPKMTEAQSHAIACWLDASLRVFEHARYRDHNKAYQCLMVMSTRLEQTATRLDTDNDIRDWCMKRLQHLTVLTLEFCNQQNDQAVWQPQATHVIESHVRLMAHLKWNEPQKHDQGVSH